jgi:hypothetical protein
MNSYFRLATEKTVVCAAADGADTAARTSRDTTSALMTVFMVIFSL